jgi:hypothetical protein
MHNTNNNVRRGEFDLSNSEVEVTSTEPETRPISAQELEPEREVEIIISDRKEKRVRNKKIFFRCSPVENRGINNAFIICILLSY